MTRWSSEPLGDLCEIQIGRTPSRAEPRYWGAGYPWLSIADMNQGRDIVETSETITDVAVRECACRLVPAGTLLFSFKLSIGKVGFARADMYTNEAIAALTIRDRRRADASYLYHALGTLDLRGVGEKAVKGVTLNRRSLGALRVPLPPLDEQARIAALMDRVEALRRDTTEVVSLLHSVVQSTFLQMFGDPVSNARDWPTMQASSCIGSIDAGTSVSGSDRTPGPDEWAVLKISAVTSGRFKPEECKVVDGDAVPANRIVPERGDLLFSRANTRELVAATCLVDQEAPHRFLPDKLWKLAVKRDVVLAEFMNYLIAHPSFRQVITRKATGTSGSMLNVSQSKLLGMTVPVPPLTLQREFAHIVWRVYDLGESMTRASTQTAKLYEAISQAVFAGDRN